MGGVIGVGWVSPERSLIFQGEAGIVCWGTEYVWCQLTLSWSLPMQN